MERSAASLCHLWMEINGSWLDQRCSWKINIYNSEIPLMEPVISGSHWMEILVTCVDKVKWRQMTFSGGGRRAGRGRDSSRHMICLLSDKAGCVLSGDDCCVCEASCISWCSALQTGGAVCHDLGLHFTQAAFCLYLHLQSVISKWQMSSSVWTFVYIFISWTHSWRNSAISTIPLISWSPHRTSLFVVIHLCVQPLCPQQSVWSLVCWWLQTQRPTLEAEDMTVFTGAMSGF